jgi:hypothetical protein
MTQEEQIIAILTDIYDRRIVEHEGISDGTSYEYNERVGMLMESGMMGEVEAMLQAHQEIQARLWRDYERLDKSIGESLKREEEIERGLIERGLEWTIDPIAWMRIHDPEQYAAWKAKDDALKQDLKELGADRWQEWMPEKYPEIYKLATNGFPSKE